MLENFKGAGPHFYLCVTRVWEQLLSTPGTTWDLAGGLGQALLLFGVPEGLPAVSGRVTACWAGLLVGTALTLWQFLEETFHTCLFVMYHVEMQISFSAWHLFTQLKTENPKTVIVRICVLYWPEAGLDGFKQTCLKLFEVICSFCLKDGTAAFQCQNFRTG